MGTTLTARLPSDLSEELERIGEEEKLDKSAVARRLLSKPVKDHKIEKAVEKYESGEVSMRKASEISGLSLREFMNVMKDKGVELQYSEKDLEEDVKALRNE